MKRTQEDLNVVEEWVLDIPRPLTGLSAGKYWAIDLHSIEAIPLVVIPELVAGGLVKCDWAITTAPRTGKTPFMTLAGDPDNLWFREDYNSASPAVGVFSFADQRLNHKALYWESPGKGKLLIGDHLYLQVTTQGYGAAQRAAISIAFEYTETTVSCTEYAAQLVSQLN